MNCTACGAPVPQGSKFCTKCGTAAQAAPQAYESASAQWFISMGNKNDGPHTGERIRAMVKDKSLHPDAFVWKDGMVNWMAVRQVPEFRSVAAPPPPPPNTILPPPAHPGPGTAAQGMPSYAAYPAGAAPGKPLLDTTNPDMPVAKIVIYGILLFLICWPIGLIMLFRDDEIPQNIKTIMIAIWVALFIGGIILKFAAFS